MVRAVPTCGSHLYGSSRDGRALQDYVREENLDLKFSVKFCDLEDPRLRGQPTSTYLHFAILTRTV